MDKFTFLGAAHTSMIEGLYDKFLEDPNSVDHEWVNFFKGFDFAKTITTGEGGMLVFKDLNVLKKAAAWHDHGHENNPSFPRWADTRKNSGFNYRMTELQGAVGIAQLKKLSHVIENQRLNKLLIKNRIVFRIFRYPSDAVSKNERSTLISFS